MPFLLISNASERVMYFGFCTISPCRCNVCEEWIKVEQIPFSDQSGWTIGLIRVEPGENRVDQFCPNWDCIGDYWFGGRPDSITVNSMFDFEEDETYFVSSGEDKALISFRFELPSSADELQSAAVPTRMIYQEQKNSRKQEAKEHLAAEGGSAIGEVLGTVIGTALIAGGAACTIS